MEQTYSQQIIRFFKGFVHAFDGLRHGWQERNMKAHLLIGLTAVGLGLWLGLERWQWVSMTLVIGFVLCAEMFNTVVEDMADLVKDKLQLSYRATKRIRDMSAGAVLLAAVTAAVVGVLLFWPTIGY